MNGLAIRFNNNTHPTTALLHPEPVPPAAVRLPLCPPWLFERSLHVAEVNFASVRPMHYFVGKITRAPEGRRWKAVGLVNHCNQAIAEFGLFISASFASSSFCMACPGRSSPLHPTGASIAQGVEHDLAKVGVVGSKKLAFSACLT